ncbi:MAG TPA: dethiobiotin synthase [Verrucomicrobiae bacterium]
MPNARAIFVTGTDTNVGKTVVTALLLAHTQAAGINVRALKPFSTGSAADETLLGSLQKASLQVNFFHFADPVAPFSAARQAGTKITLNDVLQKIEDHRASCELLFIEGAGGLLTPLGEKFTAADLITELNAEVIIAAANRLGVLNHTSLTVEALHHRTAAALRVALVEQGPTADASRATNPEVLRELLPTVPMIRIPFFKNYQPTADFHREKAKSLQADLARILDKKNPPDTEAEGTFP